MPSPASGLLQPIDFAGAGLPAIIRHRAERSDVAIHRLSIYMAHWIAASAAPTRNDDQRINRFPRAE